uniref:Uncharacterized protein n=1 Tax=Dulem virus 39 TaxID=3145757 RepID=A0AAU8B7H9_9CAUD
MSIMFFPLSFCDRIKMPYLQGINFWQRGMQANNCVSPVI